MLCKGCPMDKEIPECGAGFVREWAKLVEEEGYDTGNFFALYGPEPRKRMIPRYRHARPNTCIATTEILNKSEVNCGKGDTK